MENILERLKYKNIKLCLVKINADWFIGIGSML